MNISEHVPAPPESADHSDKDTLTRHRETLQRLFPIPAEEDLRRRRSRPRTAPVLLLLLAGAAGLWGWNPGWPTGQVQTAPGERRTVYLPDHSRVVLDGSTQLRVWRHLRSRQVELLSGRARFEVTHSRWRPFLVDAGTTRIRDHGTVFDVERHSDATEVTLWQGLVAVSTRGHSAERLLQPGQRVLASAAGIGETTAASTVTGADWPRGRLAFSRTPLRDVIRELQRYRTAQIVLTDPDLATLEVSGVFDSRHTEDVLALLPDILPVQVIYAQDGTTRIRAIQR